MLHLTGKRIAARFGRGSCFIFSDGNQAAIRQNSAWHESNRTSHASFTLPSC